MTGANRRILVVTAHPDDPEFLAWHRDHRLTGGIVLGCVDPLARDHLAFSVEARMRNRAATLGSEKGYSYAEGCDNIVVPG